MGCEFRYLVYASIKDENGEINEHKTYEYIKDLQLE